ncbi:MAG: AMIN domain-containing protein, partial [Burkholderiales bacterium]|nr:AMIN domain-containing protein [Burkholderiales bacterium]
MWPAQEYTRVTLESARALKHQFFFVNNPERLVVDLEGVDLDDELKALPGKVGTADPYIQSVRVGVNRPNVVRIVFDLKTEVKPSVFPLAPVGEYKHRLVLDIYPKNPADPLLALLAAPTDPVGEIARAPAIAAAEPRVEAPPLPVVKLEPPRKELVAKAPEKPKAPPKTQRLVIVAIDAGHGGE